MAGPYQTQDGQWQMAGRAISPEDLATWQAANAANQSVNVAPQHPGSLGQVPMQQAVPQMTEADMFAQRQNTWRNPISAGLQGLGNMTGWWK